MNKINIKIKWAIADDQYSWSKYLKEKTLFDSKEDAEKKCKEKYFSGEAAEVVVLDGEYTPGECKAYPVAVTTIKYRDFNGVLWDKSEECEYANACIILNKVIGEDVFRYGDKVKKCNVCFTIIEQSQIDALWRVFNYKYRYQLERKTLLDYSRDENGKWEEIEHQLERGKWIYKLNNIQKIFDAYGSVTCKFEHYIDIGCYRGEDYEYSVTKLLVKLNKIGVKYINKNSGDETCKTCKYRETDCGYTCKDDNPRCYVKATDEDISKRPKVYSDSFNEKDVYDWNELFDYDFDVSKIQS